MTWPKMPPTKFPLIDDPHGPFAIVVGAKAAPSRRKYAAGNCVVIADDDIGGRYPSSRRLPSNQLAAGRNQHGGLIGVSTELP